MNDDMLVTIFCDVDDFSTKLEKYFQHYLMQEDVKPKLNPI